MKMSVFLFAALATLLTVSVLFSPPYSTEPSAAAFAQTAEVDLFAPVASVIRHPRCMNCHTTTDFPRQNDDRRRHAQNVLRGADDHGVPGMKCSSCHNEANNNIAGVPGAPHWGLAPLSMAWEYMSDAQICQQLKDRNRNGDKSVANLVTHMTQDALVLWAWAPGHRPGGAARATPPLDLDEWNKAINAWADADAPCPAEGDSK